MSGFQDDAPSYALDSYALDSDDLSIIYDLKVLERPHLAPSPSTVAENSCSDNLFIKYDLSGWREKEIHGGEWDLLKARLLTSVERGKEVDRVVDPSKVAEYERLNKPVLVSGLMDFWSGFRDGTLKFSSLVARFPQIPFRFSDTHGGMMDLETYHAYCGHPLLGLMDDSPLAVYDSEFGDDDLTSCLLSEYSIPDCFSSDLFELAEEGENPPYRWILCGPGRSGTGLHIDPLMTSAWVALVEGLKLWCLFPRGTDGNEIGVRDGETGVQVSSSIWFDSYYWRLMEEEGDEGDKPYVVLQKPGEIVYVPSGWYHLVLNLEHSTAVTHNYADGENKGRVEEIWDVVKSEEGEFAKRWRKGIKEKRGDLEERIRRAERSEG